MKKLKKSQVAIIAEQRQMLINAKSSGANEANTRQHIDRILNGALGFSLPEIDAEYKVNGKKCDIALWCDEKRKGNPAVLVECKRAADALKASDIISQIENYILAENGKWGILTNGLKWIVYGMGVDGGGRRFLREVAVVDMEHGLDKAALDGFAMLTKEAIAGRSLKRIADAALDAANFNKFVCARLLMEDDAIKCLARSLHKICGGIIKGNEIRAMLKNEVIKDGLLDEASTRDEVRAAKRVVAKTVRKSTAGERRPKPTAPAVVGEVEFTISQCGIVAKGKQTAAGFVVSAGTPVRAEVKDSFKTDIYYKNRLQLEADGIIADGKMTQDHVFRSSSQAAAVIMGRNTNGRRHWVADDGRTYDEVFPRDKRAI